MRSLVKRAAAIATAGVLLAQAATPAFAGISVEISGNGDNSFNWVRVRSRRSVRIRQSNWFRTSNVVVISADTGDNSADSNTGGDVDITTGDATVGVSIVNSGNTNIAVVDGELEE